jgi:hypothetical protein
MFIPFLFSLRNQAEKKNQVCDGFEPQKLILTSPSRADGLAKRLLRQKLK